MKNTREARVSKNSVLFLAENNSVIIHDECKESLWTCGYCKLSEQDLEADKWAAEIQNPNTTEERRQEVFIEQDKEMVLDDLRECPLTREQVDNLFKLRDSFGSG